jgi:hypothetical protein
VPLVVVALLLLPIVAGNGIVSVVEAALATSCCAATDYRCAGLRSPHDCCKHMGHTVGASTTGTIERGTHALPSATAVAVVQPANAPASVSRRPVASRTAARLHDPPHLHTFALLI